MRETKGSITLCVIAKSQAPIEKASIDKMKKHMKRILGDNVNVDFIEPKPETLDLIYD